MKTGDPIVMRTSAGVLYVATFAPVVDTETWKELRALPGGSPYEFVGVIRDARDVKPYTGPSGWRDVAERRCVCGHTVVAHKPGMRCAAVAYYASPCPCERFTNAAVQAWRFVRNDGAPRHEQRTTLRIPYNAAVARMEKRG